MPPPTKLDSCSGKTEEPAIVHRCHCEERSDVAIRILCNAQHCPLPGEAERERIATACGLAMTVVFVA